jgi:uncharacterized protein (TIGR03000 family)
MGRGDAVAFTTTARKTIPSTPAKLVVALPVGVRLFIDDCPVAAGAGETTFHTPPLEEGTARYHRLRAELIRDGERLCEQALVVLRPGQESWVSFPQLQTIAAAPPTQPPFARAAGCAALGPPVQDEQTRAGVSEVRPVAFQAAEPPPIRQACAKLVIALPAGARLFIDGHPVRTSGTEMIFDTPPLEVGATYGYRVCAELFHGGQIFRQEVQVVVRAGEEARVCFRGPQPSPNPNATWQGRR